MRKAINTGIIAGVILTVIMILGTVCRKLFPANTIGANLIFTIVFIAAIAIILWIAMERYSRFTSLSWTSLGIISIFTSITAAVLFSTASFIYARFFSSTYLSQLIAQAKQRWVEREYSAQSITGQGEWNWYRTPWNFAFNNLQLMLVVLFVISLCIAFVYYSKNRSKINLHESHNNHELIF
ncbi:MAG TPA: DUF4199 family protein [Flavitalea sp.]|nr:DUF4199 family protein [Flavitalea sp.]